MKNIEFRKAKIEDLEAIVELLQNDVLGSGREQKCNLEPYREALLDIIDDENNHVLVALIEKRVVGTLQLTFIRNLTFKGGLRAQIEGVRTAEDMRGKGLGKSLMDYAIGMAKERGCHMVQLTSNKQRPEAIRFYEQCGFESSHEGFKLVF